VAENLSEKIQALESSLDLLIFGKAKKRNILVIQTFELVLRRELLIALLNSTKSDETQSLLDGVGIRFILKNHAESHF